MIIGLEKRELTIFFFSRRASVYKKKNLIRFLFLSLSINKQLRESQPRKFGEKVIQSILINVGKYLKSFFFSVWVGLSKTVGLFNLAGLSKMAGLFKMADFSKMVGNFKMAGLSKMAGIFKMAGFSKMVGIFKMVGFSKMVGIFKMAGFSKMVGIFKMAGRGTTWRIFSHA